MKTYCAFDIEVAKTLSQVARELSLRTENESFNYPHKMGFGIGVIGDTKKDELITFTDAKKMANHLLRNCDFLVSFNGKRFDLAVLLGAGVDIDTFLALQKKPHVDILADFYESVKGRFRVSLDNLAENTLGKHKTGSGADAPIWLQEGKTQQVVDYCTNDVEITMELFEYALKNGFLVYFDKENNKQARAFFDYKKVLSE